MQDGEGRETPFSNQYINNPQLPTEIQAIITTYKFGCCGNITLWQTYVHSGRRPQKRDYDFTFQVWRPSPTVQDNGCYSLVGENRFTNIMIDHDGLVSEAPKPSNIISVHPGDVVGYYTFSRGNRNNMRNVGIQLDTSLTGNSVWYYAGAIDSDPLTMGASNCPFPVGTGSERILRSSVDVRPVLSVSISK